MTLSPQPTWRQIRTLTEKQGKFLDALTCQNEYAHLTSPRILYGGAGFGGKSYALRTAAVELNGRLRDLGFPNRWGALFCIDYPKLMDRHARHFTREMGGVGKIMRTATHGLHFRFYDPSMGGFFLRNARDPEAYKGIEFDWLLIDELTEFMRDDFDNLMYLLRSGDKLPFEAFGAATNPDGVGHGWVKKLWIEGDFEYETGIDPSQFAYIPARATDNVNFRPEIQGKLEGFSDPMLVKARWEGSWDIASGSRFPQFKRQIHTFSWDDFEKEFGGDTNWRNLLLDKELFTIYGSFDYGTDLKAASALLLHAVDFKNRVWTFHETYMSGIFLREQADTIKSILEEWPVYRIYADPALAGRDSDGISRFSKFKNYGVDMFPSNNDRIEGWATFDMLLDFRENKITGEIVAPRWRIHNKSANIIRQLATAPRDERRMEDVSSKFSDDHALDSCRYMLHTYYKGARGKTEEEKTYTSPYQLLRRKRALAAARKQGGRINDYL